MGLLIYSPRYIHRAIVVAVVVFFLITVFSSSDASSPQIDRTEQPWPNKLWATAGTTAGRVFPRPGNGFKAKLNAASGETFPPSETSRELMNATFVTLVRNNELEGMLRSMHDIETRFNRNFHYDWVFLNDDEFTETFKTATTAATSGRARYGKVDAEHWSYPASIDLQFAEKTREEMANQVEEIPYASSESYRHMCRYQSGFFYRHPLVLEYEWYWRVEPNIELFCDIPFDPFRYMAQHGKKYGFVIAVNELKRTIPSLWTTVRAFIEDYPQHISNNSHLSFLTEDGGRTTSYCHFWDNFEIASLEWFRSEAYSDFFAYLDSAGGFFYERWGDASVHSIAAALTLDKGDIHFFDDIGYHHYPYMSCPRSDKKRAALNCRCKAEDNIEWSPSCTKRFFEVAGIEFPEGYDRNVPPERGVLR